MEELWDLEEAWLTGKDPSVAGLMTRSVAGTFFDMYCVGKRWVWRRRINEKKSSFVIKLSTKPFSLHLCALITFGVLSETHIYHRDFLWAWSWMIGSVSKVSIGMFWTHVLPQMIVHLLSLFPVEEIMNDSLSP